MKDRVLPGLTLLMLPTECDRPDPSADWSSLTATFMRTTMRTVAHGPSFKTAFVRFALSLTVTVVAMVALAGV